MTRVLYLQLCGYKTKSPYFTLTWECMVGFCFLCTMRERAHASGISWWEQVLQGRGSCADPFEPDELLGRPWESRRCWRRAAPASPPGSGGVLSKVLNDLVS